MRKTVLFGLLGVLLVTGAQPTTEAGPLSEAEIEHLIEVTREAARGIDGTEPEREVTISFVESIDHPNERAHGFARADGSIDMLSHVPDSTPGWRLEYLVIHEVAHVLTSGDGHGEVWLAVYRAAVNLVVLG